MNNIYTYVLQASIYNVHDGEFYIEIISTNSTLKKSRGGKFLKRCLKTAREIDRRIVEADIRLSSRDHFPHPVET